MARDAFGVWRCTVPARADGTCAIPHDSMVKVSFTKPDGTSIDRLPPWITRVTQDLSVSPVYDARFWNPPKEQRYTFKHGRMGMGHSGQDEKGGLKIYEAHGEFARAHRPERGSSELTGPAAAQSASRRPSQRSGRTRSLRRMFSLASRSSGTIAFRCACVDRLAKP